VTRDMRRMTDERRARLALLEGSQGKLSGDDVGFLRAVKVIGTQQDADRAQRVLDQAAEHKAQETATSNDDEVWDDFVQWG
jgi:hypothetical protein